MEKKGISSFLNCESTDLFNKEKTMEKKNACSGDHTCHLCTLAEKKLNAEIKPLVENPKFICFNCGRAANSEDRLCNPEPLY